jgi:hypothetical protein
MQEVIEKASNMKAAELKKELEARGISTKSFFEKTEFVRAYAEAVVDDIPKKEGSSSSGSSSSPGGARSRRATPEEPRDSSYRDVTTAKFNARDPRSLSGVVIDVTPPR